jgi:flagellar protein FlgJ
MQLLGTREYEQGKRMVTGIGEGKTDLRVATSTYEKRLSRACEEFEAIFISYMLKSAEGASGENSFFGKRNEGAVIRSMFNDNIALGIARGGGVGLATMLFERLRE